MRKKNMASTYTWFEFEANILLLSYTSYESSSSHTKLLQIFTGNFLNKFCSPKLYNLIGLLLYIYISSNSGNNILILINTVGANTYTKHVYMCFLF